MSLDAAFDVDAFKYKNGIPDQADFKGFCLAVGRRMKLLKALPALFTPVILVKDSAEAYCFSSIHEAIEVAGQVGHNSTVAVIFAFNGSSVALPLMNCSLIPYNFVNSFFEISSLKQWENAQSLCFKYGIGWKDDFNADATGSFELRNDLFQHGLVNYLYCIDGRLVVIDCDEDGPCVYGYNKLKITDLEQYLSVNPLPELSEPL